MKTSTFMLLLGLGVVGVWFLSRRTVTSTNHLGMPSGTWMVTGNDRAVDGQVQPPPLQMWMEWPNEADMAVSEPPVFRLPVLRAG